MSHRFLCNF